MPETWTLFQSNWSNRDDQPWRPLGSLLFTVIYDLHQGKDAYFAKELDLSYTSTPKKRAEMDAKHAQPIKHLRELGPLHHPAPKKAKQQMPRRMTGQMLSTGRIFRQYYTIGSKERMGSTERMLRKWKANRAKSSKKWAAMWGALERYLRRSLGGKHVQ
jgi:hypothetical protein